jgi:hypothetical protein
MNAGSDVAFDTTIKATDPSMPQSRRQDGEFLGCVRTLVLTFYCATRVGLVKLTMEFLLFSFLWDNAWKGE